MAELVMRRGLTSATLRDWQPHEGEDQWPNSEEEYALAHFLVLAAVVIPIGGIVSILSHKFQRMLEPDDYHARRYDFRRQLGLIVWSRLRGELMSAGSLVVWLWLAYETGLLDYASDFSAAWQEAHPVGTELPEVEEPWLHPREWLRWALSCHPRMPRDPSTLLHLIQDVLVALFMTKIFYYTSLMLTLQMQMKSLAAYEKLEEGSAMMEEGMLTQERQLEAMRAQLLAYIKSNAALKAKVERDAKLKESVEEHRLYVSGFLAEMIHAHTELITEFSLHTWLLLEVYVSVTATALYMCIGYRHLSLGLDLIFYGGSLYITYRLLLHRFTLRQSARELLVQSRRPQPTTTGRSSSRPRPLRTGWPHEWVDWVLFPFVGPGITGFLPFATKPSELVGLRCLQGMLWVHFYRLAQYATDPFRRVPRDEFLQDALVTLLPKVLSLLVWSLFLLPGMLEVFSLPPYLDELEHSLLLHTLRKFPTGLPADEALVPSTSAAAMARGAAAAAQAAAQAAAASSSSSGSGGPTSPSKIAKPPSISNGLSYVVMKAAQAEESWAPTWRGMRACWRWLVGLPPLRNPGQRLAEHYEWINSKTDLADGADVEVASTFASSLKSPFPNRQPRAQSPSSGEYQAGRGSPGLAALL